MARDRVQIEAAMRLAAMQENRDAGDGDMRHQQSVGKNFPFAGASQTIRQKTHNEI